MSEAGKMLAAASPVEIEAKAAETGMEDAERDAALTLFHQLTSRLELQLLDQVPDGGEPWPRHRFWFGPVAAVAGLVARLRAMDGAAELPGVAPTVFVTATRGGHAALLAAGSHRGWSDAIERPA